MDPRISILSLSQSVQGSFLPCFPEELQAWCPPLHRVSPVPAASPGPLTASASFQAPCTRHFWASWRNLFLLKPKAIPHHLPSPCRAVVLSEIKKETLTFLIQLYSTVFAHCYVSLSMARDEASAEPVKTKAGRGEQICSSH